MIIRVVLLATLLLLPAMASATTEADLRTRITIDGEVDDYAADEWVLDTSTAVPERPRDSVWGIDNDLQRIALTWDNYNLYIAVPAVTVNSQLMLFIDTMCGGVSDLAGFDVMPRNLTLGELRANVILTVSRTKPTPEAYYVDCDNPVNVLNPEDIQAVYLQDGTGDGALEIAIPWQHLGTFDPAASATRVPNPGQTVAVMAAITAGDGGGAGDGGPDPTVTLENDSTRVAVLNNNVRVPLDADEDGTLDLGISPRAEATYASAGDPQTDQVLPLTLLLDRKVIAPDNGEVARFRVALDPPAYDNPVYVTARVFSTTGQLLRTILQSEPLALWTGPVWEEWDGRDDSGAVVPGGIYILAVTGAAAPTAPASPVKASVAVIR